MGNLFKKVIASTLCVSFFSLQTAAIAEPIQVLPNGGLGGADIVNAQGGFTGVTNGTTGVIFQRPDKNDAHLNFNDNAVLNWGHLNVEKNQTLTFHNGAFVVLNNVLHGMSTFEGALKSTGSGQIIISNPNGILLQGGQFETAGALTLTTKDLTGIDYKDLANKEILNQKIENAEYKNDQAIITIKGDKLNVFGSGNAKIEAGDINILAKKIDISNADIVGKNGVVLATTDGMNFVASNPNTTITVKDSNINVATNAIAKGGVVEFRTNGNININQTGINSLKVAKANDVNIKNNLGTVGGPSIEKAEINNDGKTTIENYIFDFIKVTSNGNITVDSGVDANVVGKHDIYGTAELTSNNGSIKIWDYNIGNAILKAAKDILIDRSNIDTLNIKEAANVSLTAGLVHTIKDMFINNVSGKTTVDNYRFNNLTAKNTGDINVNYTLEHSVNNNKIDLTNVGNVTLDNVKLNTLNVNGSKDLTIFADIAANKVSNALLKATGDITINNTDFDTLTTIDAGNISINENLLSVNSIGKANLDSNGNIFIGKTNFDSPITATAAGNFNLVNSTAAEATLNIGGSATIESPIKNMKITDSNIGGNLKVDSKVHTPGSWDELWDLLTGKNDLFGDITLDNTKVVGEANLISWGDVNINNCNSIGSVFAKSQLGGIKLTDSHILGNAQFELPANEIKGLLTGHTYWEHKDDVISTNTAIDGEIYLNVNNNAEFTSPNNLHFVNPNVKGKLTAHADNKLTYEEKGQNKDLNVNNDLFNKYDISAGKELAFKTDKNINATGEFLTPLTSFIAKDIKVENATFANTSFDGNNIIATDNVTFKGDITVNAKNNATFESENHLSFNKSNVGNEFYARSNNGNVTIFDMIANKINATGKNINLIKTKGDLTVDNNTKLTAANEVLVKSETGSVSVDGSTINSKNVTVKAKQNNDVKNVNIEGTLQTSGDKIAINNCSSDKLAILNPENNKFNYAEIFGTKANTTEFANGKYLYIDLTESSLFNNDRDAIKSSANNVDEIVIFPFLDNPVDPVDPVNPVNPVDPVVPVNPDDNTGNNNPEYNYEIGQETTKNINNLRNQPVDTIIGSDFAPIAFAANENAKRSGIYKAAGDKIYKDVEEIVHITDRFNIE